MGVAVSNWILAKATALRGQLGVVSGTGIDTVLVRRLQDGDAGGHMRRAMRSFPIPGVSDAVMAEHFRPAGREGAPYKPLPLPGIRLSRARQLLTMLANYVEVRLAKEGHGGRVGTNLLTKVQFPTLASLYGAMLAGVDYVLMGAGIPREIPGALDRLARHQRASLTLDVEGRNGDGPICSELDPGEYWSGPAPALTRPRFLAIIASNLLASVLARKASGRVDGFVVEGAGGTHCGETGQPACSTSGRMAMAYHDERELPNYWKYARNFVLQDHLFEPLFGPSLRSHLALFVNDQDARLLGWEDAALRDGDVVHVIPAMSGGTSRSFSNGARRIRIPSSSASGRNGRRRSASCPSASDRM